MLKTPEDKHARMKEIVNEWITGLYNIYKSRIEENNGDHFFGKLFYWELQLNGETNNLRWKHYERKTTDEQKLFFLEYTLLSALRFKIFELKAKEEISKHKFKSNIERYNKIRTIDDYTKKFNKQKDQFKSDILAFEESTGIDTGLCPLLEICDFNELTKLHKIFYSTHREKAFKRYNYAMNNIDTTIVPVMNIINGTNNYNDIKPIYDQNTQPEFIEELIMKLNQEFATIDAQLKQLEPAALRLGQINQMQNSELLNPNILNEGFNLSTTIKTELSNASTRFKSITNNTKFTTLSMKKTSALLDNCNEKYLPITIDFDMKYSQVYNLLYGTNASDDDSREG